MSAYVITRIAYAVFCPECPWGMDAEDDDDAQDLADIHNAEEHDDA